MFKLKKNLKKNKKMSSSIDCEIGKILGLQERSLEEIIKVENQRTTSCAYFFTSFIIGLPTFIKGYASWANIGEYDVVTGVITSAHHANVKHNNKEINCYVFTESLMGDKQFNFLYPQNTSMQLLYDTASYNCRTITLGNNLLIVGFVFLFLSCVFFLIFVSTPSLSKEDSNKYLEYMKNKRNNK